MSSSKHRLFCAIIFIAIAATFTTPAFAEKTKIPPVPPVPPVPPAPEVASSVIIHHGHGSHAFLGVVLAEMSPQLRSHFGAPKDAGVLISMVEPKTPAEKAKLKVGDIIIEAHKVKIDCTCSLQDVLREMKKGDKLALKIVRNKKVKTITAVLAERKRKPVHFAPQIIIDEHGNEQIIIELEDLDKQIEKALEGIEGIENLEEFKELEKIEALKHLQLDKLGEELKKALDDPEVKKRIKELKKMELKKEQMEKRMKELEKQMKELEKKLQSKRKKLAAKKAAVPA